MHPNIAETSVEEGIAEFTLMPHCSEVLSTHAMICKIFVKKWPV